MGTYILHAMTEYSTSRSDKNSSALEFACEFGRGLGNWGRQPERQMDMVRLFARGIDFDDPSEDPIEKGLLRKFRFTGDPEALKWLLDQSPYTRRRGGSSKEPENLIFQMCDLPFQYNLALLVRTVLRKREIDSVIATMRDLGGATLLHHAAFCLGERIATFQDSWDMLARLDGNSSAGFDPLHNHEFTNLITLIHDLIPAGSELHGLSLVRKFHNTPFMGLFRRFMAGSIAQDWFRFELGIHGTVPVAHVELVAKAWLYQLKLSGVDLIAYGQKEQSLYRNTSVLR